MQRESKLRLPQLDALRGIAALSVFFFHAFQSGEQSKLLIWILGTPLAALFNGRAAVWLFFVLSGFVLNLKYVGMENYPKFWKLDFIVRRLFRIYPALLVSLLLALIFKTFVFHPAQAYAIYPEGFAKEWKVPVSGLGLVKLATVVWPGVKLDLNPPVWSLLVEMRISLIFPLIIIMVNRFPRKWANIMLLIVAYTAGFLLPGNSMTRYLPQFILGAVCARNVKEISAWLRGRGTAVRAMWLLAAFGLYGAASDRGNIYSLGLHSQFVFEQLVALGAAGFILFCAALASGTGFLCSKPMRFIGATSYSFYLTHIVFLYALSFWIIKVTGSLAVAWLLVLAVTYGVSYLVFHYIEMPMNRVGHHAVRWALEQQPLRTFFPPPELIKSPAVELVATAPAVERPSRSDESPV